MKLSAFKNYLSENATLEFILPNGNTLPPHFHVTELAKQTKHFIDCGGTERREEKISFQLWTAEDYDHRLSAEKLLSIITLAEQKLGLGDWVINFEYQDSTIATFGLTIKDNKLQLTNTFTDCLAKENCGIPEAKNESTMEEAACSTPGSSCC